MAGKICNLNELAAHLDVTRQTVDRWLKAGCPYVTKADRDAGKEWELDLAAVVDWRKDREVEKAIGTASGATIDEAKRRKTAAEAELAELDLAERRGQVVAVAAVMKFFGDQVSSARARLLALPTKAAPLMVPITDVVEAREQLDAIVRECLNELSGYDAGKFGSGLGDAGDGLPEGDSPAMVAAAEVDGKPMGGPVPEAKPRSKRRARTMDNSP